MILEKYSVFLCTLLSTLYDIHIILVNSDEDKILNEIKKNYLKQRDSLHARDQSYNLCWSKIMNHYVALFSCEN